MIDQGDTCPVCGRPDPRDLLARTRARTQLISELAELGLSASEAADYVTGVKPISELPAKQ